MSFDWRTLPPAEVLDAYPVLTLEQVAYVLGQYHTMAGSRQGELNVPRVKAIIAAKRLYPMDPDEKSRYWRVSAVEVRRYIDLQASRSAVAS
jgi:hypothetical protein